MNQDIATNDLDILSLLIGDEEEKWRNTKGELEIINQLMQKGDSPVDILRNYFKMNIREIPGDPLDLWSLILHLIMEGPHRKRIEKINTFQQAIDLIKSSSKIIVLTGAGISVSCGVPDFRSRDGIYSRLAVDFPDLDEPQSMFDIKYFVKNPRPFFKFSKEIFPGNFEPSLGHKFIKLLEEKGKLLRNYSQNIDTIEKFAGIKNVIQCHGSFATATCMRCEYKVDGNDIKPQIMNQEIPICWKCTSENERNFDKIVEKKALESENINNLEEAHLEKPTVKPTLLPIMKPDIVFFGEGLPKDFHSTLAEDKLEADLLIVIGSSLKVRPVAHIPGCLSTNIPQILINREPLSNHSFDVELLGDSDVIVSEICRHLGWNQLTNKDEQKSCEISMDSIKEIGELQDKINGLLENIDEDENKQKNVSNASEDNQDAQSIGNTVQSNRNLTRDEDPIDTSKENAVESNSDLTRDDDPIDTSKENNSSKMDNSAKIFDVADLLDENISVIRVPPNRYVFKGAEFYLNALNLDGEAYTLTNDCDDDSDYGDSSSNSSSTDSTNNKPNNESDSDDNADDHTDDKQCNNNVNNTLKRKLSQHENNDESVDDEAIKKSKFTE